MDEKIFRNERNSVLVKEQNVLEKLHIGVNCNIKESCRYAGKKNQGKSQSGFTYHVDKVSQ